jgi:hypothetical protein
VQSGQHADTVVVRVVIGLFLLNTAVWAAFIYIFSIHGTPLQNAIAFGVAAPFLLPMDLLGLWHDIPPIPVSLVAFWFPAVAVPLAFSSRHKWALVYLVGLAVAGFASEVALFVGLLAGY